MAIYLKSSALKGSVTAKGFENCIECLDADFAGVSRPTSMSVGKSMDRYNTTPSFGEITLVKYMDKSSIAFFEYAHNTKVIPELEIHYVITGDTPQTYSKTILKNAIVSHYREYKHQHQKQPIELINIAYTEMERSYIARNPDNTMATPLSTGYNLERAEKL